MDQSQDLEKPLLLDDFDVESQDASLNYVSMSIWHFLAWHVLSFLLGILTTFTIIFLLTDCPPGATFHLIRP